MSYIGPIEYGSYREPPPKTSVPLMLALIFAASMFVALLLVTAKVAVKLEPDQVGSLTAGP